MHKELEDAFIESINHWERLVSHVLEKDVIALKKEGWTSHECKLCTLYNYMSYGRYCAECPVYKATGCSHCGRTPYDDASSSLSSICRMSNPDVEAWYYCTELVVAEVEFLRNLYSAQDPVGASKLLHPNGASK